MTTTADRPMSLAEARKIPPVPGEKTLLTLRAGTLPCGSCGVAVPEPRDDADVTWLHLAQRITVPGTAAALSVPVTTCPDCEDIATRAAAILAVHRGLGAKVGRYRATVLVEGMLRALTIVGRPWPDPDITPRALGAFIRHLGILGDAAAFAAAVGRHDVPLGQACHKAYGHVRLTDLNRLRAASLAARVEKATATRPVPVRVPPPPLDREGLPRDVFAVAGACMVCGLAAVTVQSDRLAREGGAAAAAQRLWTQRLTDPRALDCRQGSATAIAGFTCPTCTDAVRAEGALGPSALERAVMATAGRPGGAWPDSLPRVVAFGRLVFEKWRNNGSAPAEPGAVPWEHVADMERVCEALGVGLPPPLPPPQPRPSKA